MSNEPDPAGRTAPPDESDPALQTAMQLDAARAYLDMGDRAAARTLLEQVMDSGSAEEQMEARRMYRVTVESNDPLRRAAGLRWYRALLAVLLGLVIFVVLAPAIGLYLETGQLPTDSWFARVHPQPQRAAAKAAPAKPAPASATPAAPVQAANTALCDDATIALVTQAAKEEVGDHEVIDSTCKPWPYKPQLRLAAVAYQMEEFDAESDGGVIGIQIAVIDASGNTVIARASDEVQEDSGTRYSSMKFDTARYDLAPGQRAFGLRVDSGRSPPYADGSATDFLALYLYDGKSLRQVLGGLAMSRGRTEFTEGCEDSNEGCLHEEAALGIALLPGSSHGLRDLDVSTTSDQGRRYHAILRFDGKTYPTSEWDTGFRNFWWPQVDQKQAQP